MTASKAMGIGEEVLGHSFASNGEAGDMGIGAEAVSHRMDQRNPLAGLGAVLLTPFTRCLWTHAKPSKPIHPTTTAHNGCRQAEPFPEEAEAAPLRPLLHFAHRLVVSRIWHD
jgi:hypothetical protein